jgi:ATP-binding cassette subfamily B protein
MAALEEEKLPSKLNLGIWLRLGKYAARHWVSILLIFVFMLLTSFYDSAFVPVMNAAAIDAASGFASVSPADPIWGVTMHLTFISGAWEMDITFLQFVIAEAAFILVRSLSIFVTFYLTSLLSMHIMVGLRRDTFRNVQELSFSYFDKTNSGWLIARMTNDTASIGDVLAWDFQSIVWTVFEIIFTIVTMMSRSWYYGLIVLASVPPMCVIIPLFERAMLRRWRTARNAYSHFVGWLAEAINGAKTIKTLSIEDEVEGEAKEITDDIRAKRFRARRINSVFQPIVSLTSRLMIALIIGLGVYYARNGAPSGLETAADLATIVLFVSFVQSIYSPIQNLSEIFSEFMAAQASAEKVGMLLDEKPAIRDKPEVIEKYGTVLQPKKENYETLKGDIDFEDVTFSYTEGVEVIHPLTLHVKAGTSLAIVGETGSGKTTMANLLCRFYEPTSGTIKVDGVDYLDRSLGWLRSNIGYVQQQPFVFSGTYKDNIRYGKLDATDEEIESAAKIAGIHDFIMSQKNGYDTVLEEGGSGLSQGQKQLISFARAVVRNPRILILDEATSSIDTETEAEVQKAMLRLLKGRTSITIAHRLSTIVHCDRIIVLDHGKIVEDGNHVSLMEKDGVYRHLYMNQFQDLSISSQIDVYGKQIEGKGIKL